MYHDLGLGANVVVSASYKHQSGDLLTAPLLFKALQLVIKKQPALSVVVVPQPGTKKGRHRLWEAQLQSIDINACVSFLDGYDESSHGLIRLLEAQNNYWFDLEDLQKPLWKLIVVNRTHVIFVYHHCIADGMGGVHFHQHLLDALNLVAKTKDEVTAGTSSPVFIVQPPDTPLPVSGLEVLERGRYTIAMVRIVLLFIYIMIMRTFLPRRKWALDDAKYPQMPPSLRDPPSKEERTITQIEYVRLDPSTLAKCLRACREHQTTVTSLLHVLIQVTLVTDLYPNATYGVSGALVSLRRYLKPEDSALGRADDLRNLTGGYYTRLWLSEYRRAGIVPESSKLPNGKTSIPVNSELFWLLARRYKDNMHTALSDGGGKTPHTIQDVLAMKLVGDNIEDMADNLVNVSRALQRSFVVSNLGAFGPGLHREAPLAGGTSSTWQVDDVLFAASTTAATVGYVLYFGLVSMKGGGCNIIVTYDNRTIEQEKVRMLLDGIEGRLEALLEDY